MITDDQVKEYAKEWEFYREAHNGFSHYLIYLLELSKAENQKLQEENEELRNVVKFYADISNWNEVEHSNGCLSSAICGSDKSSYTDADVKDLPSRPMFSRYFGGKKARRALSNL